MNLFKLSPDTLYNLTCDVIDTLEYMIPESSFLSNNEVYAQLKETLGYSLVHIRNVFDFSIGTTLAKYITRRKYTYLLLKISAEKFEQLTYDELTEQVEKDVSSYDLSEIDWAEYLTHFTYLVEGLKDYREDLASKHSDIDQKICDILHYIELCETNDEEAIDLIELLRVCRENRREIKDELQRIEYFQNNFGTSANAAKAKQALKCIKGLENRKYRPRKYEKLFENCILRDKDPSKAELRGMQIGYEDRKQKFSMEHTYTYEGGEETMFEERKETPYDGKENDWLAFAKQQAEFYKNAGQYITNLQLDIRELDDEIEAILLKAEDAHCNAAQGYKVFKRLRELRIEKKAKTKELNCLYALTDYMDCDALADTCEDNLAEIKGIMEVQEANDVTRIQPVENGEIQVVANIKDMVG